MVAIRLLWRADNYQKKKHMEPTRRNATSKSKPWMIVGDFNEIFLHYQKFGGQQKSEKLMRNFLDALGHVGDYFT